MPIYHCESCGWSGERPIPLEEVAGERLIWATHLCPRCWAEVVEGEAPEPPQGVDASASSRRDSPRGASPPGDAGASAQAR
jgi:hypothetical protein